MNGIIAALMGVVASAQNCQAVRWVDGPRLEGGAFKGTAAVDCNYEGQGGGGFPQLEAYLIDRMKRQATQIYAGPIYGQTEGMPSTAFDFAFQIPFQGETVTVRQDGFVATDDHTRLVSAMIAKSIQGGSYARYLKKFDIRFDVTPASGAANYRATVGARVEIQKPAVIPGNVFRDQVKQAIEKTVMDQKDEILKELADHT